MVVCGVLCVVLQDTPLSAPVARDLSMTRYSEKSVELRKRKETEESYNKRAEALFKIQVAFDRAGAKWKDIMEENKKAEKYTILSWTTPCTVHTVQSSPRQKKYTLR